MSTIPIANLHDREWCQWCGNTGWVDLAGTIHELGSDYPRGRTPCRWCTLGSKIFATYTDRPEHEQPLSNYTAEDVIPDGRRPTTRRDPQAAAKLATLAQQMAAGTPTIKPPPWIVVRRATAARLATAAARAADQIRAEAATAAERELTAEPG